MRIEIWVFCVWWMSSISHRSHWGSSTPLPRGGVHIVECVGGFPTEGALAQEGMMIDETTHE